VEKALAPDLPWRVSGSGKSDANTHEENINKGSQAAIINGFPVDNKCRR
jgi:hypothetical protein